MYLITSSSIILRYLLQQTDCLVKIWYQS